MGLRKGSNIISIKNSIIIVFIMLLLTSIGIIGYIVFSNWIFSADKIITKMLEEMSTEISSQVDASLVNSLHNNAVNYELLKNGIVDLSNETEREKYFVSVLKTQSNNIYSFSYGTENGEYYGARRNPSDTIEIMRDNADTGGHSWYYSVTSEMTAEERVLDAGKFDPRTRDWYKAAKAAQKPVFSAIYKHFVMNDLAVSAADPIYDKNGKLQGVLGTHIVLSNMNNLLKKFVQDKNGFAVIAEKASGELVANSFDQQNFTILKNGTFKRLKLGELKNQALTKAYEHYQSTQENHFNINYGNENLYINLTEYHQDGLDWLVISAIPESLLLADIVRNIKLTILLSVLGVILSISIYYRLTNKFFKPIDSLIKVTEELSQGDLSQRVSVVRNDEIGKISKSFNKMADTIYKLVNNLEETVKERTKKLNESNNALKENKDNLRLILDSTAEAIYGMDNKGYCTFSNASCLRILGYNHQDELMGKNMHSQIHHSRKDGTPIELEKCRIYQAFLKGEGTHVDDEVFWRADGTCFDVEYFSYPQYRNGVIVGAVVTFLDITERKKAESDIRYLSYHDYLTGLYNRMFFEEELKRLDTERNLPISIIIGDVDCLKLTNDIFGHTAGDKLLQKVAEIFKKVCRADDIIARIGGDEFVILLPKTKGKEAKEIILRIKREFSQEQIIAIKGSISVGSDVKEKADQNIIKIMENAEDKMYQEKTLNRQSINSGLIKTILKTLHEKSPKEKEHSCNVSELCQSIGQAMNLSDVEIRRLKEAGYLHDIGRIALEDKVLQKEDSLSELSDQEIKEIREHPVVGYRILNVFDDTLDLAESILAHHENWDGSGYPKGLKGTEIPIISRIIAVAEGYNEIIGRLHQNEINKEIAIREIRQEAGSRFDPEIVDIFAKIILKKGFGI